MKLVFVFIALCAFVAIVRGKYSRRIFDRYAKTRRYVNRTPNARGNYYYAYDTSNAIHVKESGNPYGVRGSYNYISPEGKRIELSYTADANGYHPVGKHLPTPPPIPDYIQRSLEYIRTHAPAEKRKQRKRISPSQRRRKQQRRFRRRQ